MTSLQGHGSANCYGGISTSLKEATIVILPVPFDQTTTYQYGTHRGPAALIEASRNLELYDIETDSEAYLRGIYTDQPIVAKSSQTMLERTYQRTRDLLSLDKFVVTLGGEHAISPAPIRAHAEKYGPISVLQFDAHADLVPAYEGNPLSHASAISRVREIPGVSHVVSVGIRSMSSEEKPWIDAPNTFFAHDLFMDAYWMDAVVEQLGERVYITFDLDVFDSSIMPATGTPEPGGLSWHQVTHVLRKVAQKRNIVGCDVVELCPIPKMAAPDFLAAKLVYKILSYIFEA